MQSSPSPAPTATAQVEPAPLAEGGSGPRRSGRGPRDMALSMIVLLVPVALIVALFRFTGGEQVQVVDPAAALAQARSAGAFTVLAPHGLAEGWRVASASCQSRDTGVTLRIGYLTPDGAGVQLVESSQPADALLATELSKDGRLLGAVTVAGRPWQSYSARPGERALVLVDAERTVIVVGRADLTVLGTLAGALA